jgi:uncharacterized phage protein gp47/JayE
MADVLPAYLTDQTQAAILQRMLGNVPAGVDTTEGSFVWDAISPASIELATAAIWAAQVLQYGFAETTYGPYLDLRGDEVGLTREVAQAAAYSETFVGAPGTFVANGTVVCTPADNVTNTASIEFTTQADATIPEGGSIGAPITAVVAGAAGNVALGAIAVMPVPINGVASLSNTSQTIEGVDTESDPAFLVRYLTKIQNPGTSGNKADYTNWALSVAGVGLIQVNPLWNGNGTVKVVLLGTDYTPAASPVVAAVQALICPGGEPTGAGMAPIGATVTVAAATGVDINVTATMTLDGSVALEDVQTAFATALAGYLAGIAFAADPSPKYVKIGSLLLDMKGVIDYADLLVNGGTANIAIAAGSVAVVGTVTLS